MKAVKGKYYFGGIHPRGMKELSANAALDVLSVDEVAISTHQSAGKPAITVVKAGQSVKCGELIAQADGDISSNVFASISGTVKEIKDVDGEEHIFITSDKSDATKFLPPLTDPDADEIRQRIKDCGIVGLGGAGFPTAVKVSTDKPVDTLIVNGAECEPYLTCDYRLMIEKTEEIAKGARYIAKALGVKKIIIGIESNKPDAVRAFEAFEDIQPVILRKQYPAGGEKQIIYTTTGRRLGIKKLPADVGVIVQNVGTCFAVYEAIENGKPLIERALTVSGKAVKEPKNLWVKVGTPVRDIVEYCGGESLTPKKVVTGGPMTGNAVASYDVYTRKTTSGVLLLSEKEAAAEQPTPCINCGKCADVCPMHLMPMNTAFYSAAGDFESAEKYGNATSCIECGACEYVCPAKRPLIQAIRKTKAELKKNDNKPVEVHDVAGKTLEEIDGKPVEEAAPENLKPEKEENNG
ncbi:MAG: electron transport complex subunit RsxC [Clostridia bacterium]|nr:electron transport complex subunit RsxC [Clostridia bacterium]